MNREQRRRMKRTADRDYRRIYGTDPTISRSYETASERRQIEDRLAAGGCHHCDADLVAYDTAEGAVYVHVGHEPDCPRLATLRRRN
jgi:hypothetical protein